MRHVSLAVALALSSLPAAVSAQTFLSGNHSIGGWLCAGPSCTFSELNPAAALRLKGTAPGILFSDESAGDRDWRLKINDAGFDSVRFYDQSAFTHPFSIEGGAPESAFFVNSSGQIGLGTSVPGKELHIVDGNDASIRLEQDGSGGFTPWAWDLQGDEVGFGIRDVTNNRTPFRIEPGNNSANSLALVIDTTGSIGIGNAAPGAKLHIDLDAVGEKGLLIDDGLADGSATADAYAHIRGQHGDTRLLVEEVSSTGAPRTLFEMKNNGRPEIVMANTATNGEWSFGAGTNFVLKQGGVGTTSAAKTKYLTLKSGSGDLEISGQIITGGPSCGAGCDAVFSPDYDLPSIERHAEAMFALGHLPNVGPTSPDAPVNLSEKLGTMLNELEHAHIYIARQNARIAQLEATVARLVARQD